MKILLTRFFFFVLCASLSLGPAHADVKIGERPPKEVGELLDGTVISLDNYQGKVVVVSFWATWCAPCMKELPILEGIQKLAGDRVQVIAVNIEERAVFRRIQRALAEFKLLLAYDAKEKYGRHFDIRTIPLMVIIGRDGKVVRVNRGYGEDSLEKIANDLNQAIAAPYEPPTSVEDAK